MTAHLRFISLPLLLIWATVGTYTACDFSSVNVRGSDASTTTGDGSTGHGGDAEDTGGDDWPPEIESTTETGTFSGESSELTFFDGNVVLKLDAGALPADFDIEVTQRLVTVGDLELVGYVWGPHGKPIDPAAQLSISVPVDHIAPGVALTTAKLVTENDGALVALDGASAKIEGGRLLLSGELGALETVLIGF